jgi:uncharacterized protein (DUF2267 family)
VDRDEFYEIVQTLGGVDREGAELATEATLRTLAERIDRGEAVDLVEQLPPEIGPLLHTGTGAEGFGLEEFLERVAKREDTSDLETARRHARAVLAALQRAVSEDEYADLVAELPRDFGDLLPVGEDIRLATEAELVERVASRADIDHETARALVDAVLETLAERIAPGEVDDLIVVTDIGLRPVLLRGKQAATSQTRRMDADEFVERVAERTGIDPLDLRDLLPHVFTALHAVLGDEEFRDIVAQLPPEYDPLWAA